jgi:NAD(P)-dependent dehydrogenase (short-subunit alcohol dehydrogenase family)
MDDWYAGKVALVTGAASGIGRATALAFAARGAKVVAADLDSDGARAVASEIGKAGGEAISVKADVSREDDVAAMVGAAVSSYGRIDCAFNNAGIGGGFKPLHEFDLAEFDRVIAVNLTSVFLCMKHEIPVMAGQRGGAIVNNASVAGVRGAAKLGPYVASKHGVVGLTKTAALEYAAAGIRVNAVCPGWTDTGIIKALNDDPDLMKKYVSRVPVRRLGRPEEVASAVLWLCSDAASFAVGQIMVLDGGMSA